MNNLKEHPIIQSDLERILGAKLPWERFAGKTVLVSGASGFIAAYLVKTLLRLNDTSHWAPAKVIALVRREDAARQCFSSYLGREDLSFLYQDVCQPVQLDEAIHFIIHAAGPGSPRAFGKDPLGTFNANVLGTRELLELATRNPVEGFLFLSSGEVYGLGNDTIIPTHENAFGYLDPTLVRSCYGEGKRAGETLCACYFASFGVPTSMARIFHSYGPGMPLSDGRVFTDFVADILAKRDITMRSDGLSSRAFCYLSDTVEGLFTILLNGTSGVAYNVGNDKAEIQIKNLAKILIQLYPYLNLHIYQENNSSDTYIQSQIQRGCPDISRIRQLGWAPKISIENGFRRTIDSYQ